jgi:hypothetical protein
MNPDSNENVPPAAPTSLPVMPAHAQPGASAAVSQPAQQPALSTTLAEQVNGRAKALVEQYQHNPYRLCGELQQLKAQYLQDQFHISIKAAEN